MEKYSLWSDTWKQIDSSLTWEAIKEMNNEKLTYADERIKAEASGVMAKGFGYLNASMMLLYVLIPTANRFLFRGELRVQLIANVLYLTVLIVDYIMLYRFAKRGIIRGNAAAGSVIWGCIFPMVLFLLADDVSAQAESVIYDSYLFPILLIAGVVMTVVVYKIANRAYNRAMREEE